MGGWIVGWSHGWMNGWVGGHMGRWMVTWMIPAFHMNNLDWVSLNFQLHTSYFRLLNEDMVWSCVHLVFVQECVEPFVMLLTPSV
jgi:hypothetical protein